MRAQGRVYVTVCVLQRPEKDVKLSALSHFAIFEIRSLNDTRPRMVVSKPQQTVLNAPPLLRL